MAEAGLNINYVAFHFDIHKTIAYRKSNRFVQTKLAGDRPRSGRQTKKLTPLEERFIQITSRRVTFQTANLLCITSRNCLWYASVHQHRPKPSPKHMENVQNIDILSFWKTFYDRHCAPYKWNFAVFDIDQDCNNIYCQKNPYSVRVNFNVDFCNK